MSWLYNYQSVNNRVLYMYTHRSSWLLENGAAGRATHQRSYEVSLMRLYICPVRRQGPWANMGAIAKRDIIKRDIKMFSYVTNLCVSFTLTHVSWPAAGHKRTHSGAQHK